MAEEPPEPREKLNYRDASTSPFDRPVESTVRIAERLNRIRRPRRWMYYAIMLPAIAALLWYLHHLMPQVENVVSGK